MKKNPSILQLLSGLWQHISKRRRAQFGLLLMLMLLAAFAEIVSIGSVLPFLSVLSGPERVFTHPAAQPVIRSLGLKAPADLLLPLAIIFGVATLGSGLLRLLLLWLSTRLSFAVGAELGISIYRRTLYQPYSFHCQRNSSETISGILNKCHNVISNTIIPTTIFVSSIIILITILFALLSVDTVIALTAFGGFGLIYIAIIWITRGSLIRNGELVASESVKVLKSLQEGLGGIRDVLIDGSQAIYCDIYRKADLPLRRAQGNNAFISASPRYGMEALGMLLLVALAYTLGQQEGGVGKALPVLGALALGAQRLLPVLQQAYACFTSIQGGRASLMDTLSLLNQPLPDHAEISSARPLLFERSISIKNLCFRYSSETPFILNNLDIEIVKGGRVGIIGTTGSGKSTLLDIIMGLLEPSIGVLEIDGQVVSSVNNRAWQLHLAHVPQMIFLSDTSIEENIAFGVPRDKIDSQRVRQAALQAQISDTIDSWPEQYKTTVGERGIRLSGGQRQRIGIARALYKKANVIILDEATSALDSKTEDVVMNAIETFEKDLTIIIVAHRISTLKNCTQIVELENGRVKRIGTYSEIASRH